MLAMFDAKAHLRPCSAVGSKLVRDHDARWRNGGFQELRHEFSRCKAVSATLDQNLKNEAVLIDGARASSIPKFYRSAAKCLASRSRENPAEPSGGSLRTYEIPLRSYQNARSN